MNIQLFISRHAREGQRLRAVLPEAMQGVSVTQYQRPEDVGRVVCDACNEKKIAVIMVAERKELIELSQWKNTWDRLWTILVLPSSEPEIISLGHALRPRFMTFSNSDFSDVVAVLRHICRRVDGVAC